jgi:O-antigen/teichoic acid export membrane protein
VGTLFAIGASSLLPVIVLTALGATPSAHFYIVSLIAMAAQLVPTVLATSLLVEVSSSSATFEEDGRRVVRQLVMLLGPLVIALVVLAEPILSIFGPAYAADGASTLRLLALAGIPFSIINLAFIRLRLERRVGRIVVIQVALAISLIGLTTVLIPQMGVVAIGVVTLATQSIVAAVLARAELRPLFAGFGRPRRPDRPGLQRLDLRSVDDDARPVNG